MEASDIKVRPAIQDLTGIRLEEQHLSFEGTVLEDGHTWAYYKVTDESYIFARTWTWYEYSNPKKTNKRKLEH